MATKKTIKETVEKAVQAAEPVINEAVKKAEPVIAEAVKKAEPMAKKAKETAKTAAKKAAPAAKKAEAKVKEGAEESAKVIRAALAPEVYIQMAGKELDCNEIQERCRQAYKAASKKAIRSIAVYIKPEDNAAYYVINGEQGKIEL